MTVKEFIDTLKKVRADETFRLKIHDGNAEKTMEINAVEVNKDGIFVHGEIIMAVYQALSDYDERTLHLVASDISKRGMVYIAIRDAFFIDTTVEEDVQPPEFK